MNRSITGGWAWRKLAVIRDRDGGDCWVCGRCLFTDGIPDDDATVHHVIPKSRGGSNELDNLVACCRSCNTFGSLDARRVSGFDDGGDRRPPESFVLTRLTR